MDFYKPLTYFIDDADWLKKLTMLAFLGIAQIVPIIGSIFAMAVLTGIMIDIVRKVINKQPLTIPNLEVGKQFLDGVKIWVIGLIYSIPTVVLGIVIAIITALGGGVQIWGSSNDNTGAIGAAGVVVIILISCVGLIIMLYSLLVAFITPAFYGRYAQFGTIGSALNFKEVFKTAFKKPVPYLLALLGVILVGIIGGIAGSILSSLAAFVGIGLTMAFINLANGHFYGQAYLESTEVTI